MLGPFPVCLLFLNSFMHGVFHQVPQGLTSDDTPNGGDSACFSESPRGLLDNFALLFIHEYTTASTMSYMKGSDF